MPTRNDLSGSGDFLLPGLQGWLFPGVQGWLLFLREERVSGGMVLQVDHLYLIHQSPLCAILNGYAVIMIDEVLSHRFFIFPVISQNRTHLLYLPALFSLLDRLQTLLGSCLLARTLTSSTKLALTLQ